MKRVVVFGAGLVSRPLVRYLLDHGFGVTVASRTVTKAEQLLDGHPDGRAVAFLVDGEAATRDLVASHDLAVSLLPAPHHPRIARACLDLATHMVTTSYVSPEMKALDAEARDKNLLLLNEIGVDPGIDHMSAMQVIENERKTGATLVGFSSWCGGLPAPEANDNPFGYKFSWSPRGVLVAARNGARYLENGAVVEIAPEDLFADPAVVEIPGVGSFEGYANRDSVSYLDTYHFDRNEVRSIFRGTLRNLGHCKLYTQLIELGLLDVEPERDLAGMSYANLMDSLFGAPAKKTIPAKLGVTAADAPLGALEFIGMFSDRTVELESAGMLDVMALRMADALAYQPGERDMLLMRHDLSFAHDDDGRLERVTAILVDYGIPYGDSSMARTVSLPAAIGARMVLEDKIRVRGVQIPIRADIYDPVLTELERMGICFTETRAPL
ncbi:MAG: saccharopine dehydrogenase C-terminal domain-containing protein [Acidobacteriota bacterium]|nr:saccharopine dehydrogenase C-terminal domain-containing protein [Acidobacteriota bacterium]